MYHDKKYMHIISLSKVDTPEERLQFYTWVAAAQWFHSPTLNASKIKPPLPRPARS